MCACKPDYSHFCSRTMRLCTLILRCCQSTMPSDLIGAGAAARRAARLWRRNDPARKTRTRPIAELAPEKRG